MPETPEPAAAIWQTHRDYLLLLARVQVGKEFAGKIDLSGIVQQTVWEASREVPPKGDDEHQRAWLRTLLANNLRDELRRLTAARRDVRRETPLAARLDASSARIEAWLAGQDSSPSQKAARSEELSRLARALAELPDDQQRAIELHHFQGEPLAIVAEQIGRNKEATAALLYRALKKLRLKLERE